MGPSSKTRAETHPTRRHEKRRTDQPSRRIVDPPQKHTSPPRKATISKHLHALRVYSGGCGGTQKCTTKGRRKREPERADGRRRISAAAMYCTQQMLKGDDIFIAAEKARRACSHYHSCFRGYNYIYNSPATCATTPTLLHEGRTYQTSSRDIYLTQVRRVGTRSALYQKPHREVDIRENQPPTRLYDAVQTLLEAVNGSLLAPVPFERSGSSTMPGSWCGGDAAGRCNGVESRYAGKAAMQRKG